MTYWENQVTLQSVSFLAVFTSFSAIQNLIPSITKAWCRDCQPIDRWGPCQDPLTMECAFKVASTCDAICPELTLECSSSVASVSLGALYLTFMLSCLLASSCMSWTGEKKAMIYSFGAYSLFCATNTVNTMYEGSELRQWILIFPPSIFVGVAAAILWTAQGSFLTKNAIMHAMEKNISTTQALAHLNGIFWSICQLSQILGNLAASVLLHTLQWSRTALFILYTCFAVGGNLMLCFVQDVEIPKPKDCLLDVQREKIHFAAKEDTKRWNVGLRTFSWMGTDLFSSIQRVYATSSESLTLRLIPLFLFHGMEQGFTWGQFTTKFIRVSLGEESIGYIMTLYGLCNVLGSYLSGKMIDRIGALLTLWVGSICFLLSFIGLKASNMQPCDSQWELLASIACLMGIGDAGSFLLYALVFRTTLSVLVGQSYSHDPSLGFACQNFYSSAAISAAFFLHSVISLPCWILGIASLLLASMLAYSLSCPRNTIVA